jgi:FlaA1/EpsC-like NDP-sugar epimerase
MLVHSDKRKLFQLAASGMVLLPLFALTYYAAFLLRFAGQPDGSMMEIYFGTLLWLFATKWLAFLWFRLHQGWTRFVGFHDLLVIWQAVTCGTLGFTLADAMCLPYVTIPRSVILIDWGATLLALTAIRALPRLARSDSWHRLAFNHGTISLIAGANDAGETLLRAIRYNPALTHHIIGFIDDRRHVQGCCIGGVPVLGTCDDLPRLAERYGVEEVLITSGELPGKQVRRLILEAQELGFRVKVLPSYEQLLAGRVDVRPREVAIEDLLCRESVDLDLDAIRGWLTGRRILVTGSAGSIGSEICRQLLKLHPAKLILLDRAETGQFYLDRELRRLANRSEPGIQDASAILLSQHNSNLETAIDVRLADLTDRARLAAIFQETQPEIIFHAAAYKHVPLMESHCGEAVKNIVLATRNLTDLADANNVQALVMISTDKAVNPTSIMGSCKRLAEQYVQAWSNTTRCRFVTVRFGNVLDSSGSVVPLFREQIAQGGPVTVTHPEITRFFMLIPEAAQLVIQAGAMGKGGEIFVLDMGEPVKIMDLAHDLIRLSGLRVGEDIEVQITGLRPGEKLFEELYDAGESHQRTNHPKIMVAASARRNLLQVIADIRRLERVVNDPNEVVKAALGEIIPLYGESAEARHRVAA